VIFPDIPRLEPINPIGFSNNPEGFTGYYFIVLRGFDDHFIISWSDPHEFNRVIFDISHAVPHRQSYRNGLTNFPAVQEFVVAG
jgi:hypothetical protein